MKSLISEFSYGFALTHEFVLALGSLSAAPIFPSLIEEGRTGGGYDVKLEAPGIPLFLQFKRSECLQRRSAREIQAGARLDVPYYRFQITGKRDSDQHDLLIALDNAPNIVLYAAPLFHMKAEFDDAFLGGTVRQRSFYVRPTSIGAFSDLSPHYLSFDGSRFFVMSEPREIEGFGARELVALLSDRLAAEKRTLRETLSDAVREAETARSRMRLELERRARASGDFGPPTLVADEGGLRLTSAENFRRRQEDNIDATPLPDKPSDPDRAALQRLADIGLREFNAQLYIVQAD